MARKSKKDEVAHEKILEVVLNMNERMATKDDLQRVKNELERKIDDVLEEVEPIRKAVDKDAVTTVHHEKRITLLERKVGTVTK